VDSGLCNGLACGSAEGGPMTSIIIATAAGRTLNAIERFDDEDKVSFIGFATR
jgi:hypothetical protein